VRFSAYVLAGDPYCVERSVMSYYDLVDRIFVSYDQSGRGWTGAPISIQAVLSRISEIDRDQKVVEISGDYMGTADTPMGCETLQRQAALNAASENADWVLQLDTDEVLPRPRRLVEILDQAYADGHQAVEWPMRVLFGRSVRGQLLEVCEEDGAEHFEYPGAIAVRGGVQLAEGRRVIGGFLRPVVTGSSAIQLSRPPEDGETRWSGLDAEDAVWHYSWVGPSARIRSKIASWGHNDGWRSQAFYWLRWRPAPILWRLMRDFHPFAVGLWPALKISDAVDEEPG
jgi:hypothetical protein